MEVESVGAAGGFENALGGEGGIGFCARTAHGAPAKATDNAKAYNPGFIGGRVIHHSIFLQKVKRKLKDA